MEDVTQGFVSRDARVDELINVLGRFRKGIALIVDEEHRLLDTLTDGDLRRAVLAGIGVDSPLSQVVALKPRPGCPISAPVGTPPATLLAVMQERIIQQIPLLDEGGRVVDLVALDDLLPRQELPVQAVIMAGGFGKRLMPLTVDTPKPMLPVGDRPLLEHIVGRLKDAGIHRMNITTHHMAEKIVEHFQDGERFGVQVDYVNEDQPLGTAGALSLLDPGTEPFLVLNGDILTNIDYRSVYAFHREHKADLTVCVRKYDVQVPYGVVECTGAQVDRIAEKPTLTFFVNAGIYLLEPSVVSLIPSGERYDMTDLVERLLKEGRRVASFPIVEYWLDIGRHDDYVRAQEAFRMGTVTE